MNIRKIFFICIICISFIHCKKDVPAPIIYNYPSNFSEIFENFWNQMNSNYIYWDKDTTNWDQVYYIYKPLFAALDIKRSQDIYTSIDYFKQITGGLFDNHYIIQFTDSAVTGNYIYPALNRKLISSNFHSPYSYQSIDTNYLDPDFYSGFYITSDQHRLILLSGTIQKSILYFNCNEFALEEAFLSPGNNSAKNVLQYFFRQLNNPSIKGIIIDVRNNPGGNITDLNFFIGHFIDKPLHFGFSRYKSGIGRLDFTPWINATILPQLESKAFMRPLVVLADNYTVSLAEAVTMAIKVVPKGKFIGEATWGATGPITANAVYNDGQFIIPGFLSVYTSSSEFKYINGKSYEQAGFPPDIAVPFNISALNSGDDQILDKAISSIN